MAYQPSWIIQYRSLPSWRTVVVLFISLNFWDEAWFFSFSDYCLHLYFHNVSADMLSGLQVFVELGNLHGTSNYVLYWIHGVTCSDSVSHNRVQVLRIPILLQQSRMNPQPPDDCLLRSLGNQRLYPLQSESFGTYELNVLTWQGLLLLCMIFTCAHIQIFFFI